MAGTIAANNNYLGRRGRMHYVNNSFRSTRKSHAKRINNNSFSTTQSIKSPVLTAVPAKSALGHANNATRIAEITGFRQRKNPKI